MEWRDIKSAPMDGTRVLIRHKIGLGEGDLFGCSIAEIDPENGLWLIKPPFSIHPAEGPENKMGYVWFGEGQVVGWMHFPK